VGKSADPVEVGLQFHNVPDDVTEALRVFVARVGGTAD
jgi:hypothetical protein